MMASSEKKENFHFHKSLEKFVLQNICGLAILKLSKNTFEELHFCAKVNFISPNLKLHNRYCHIVRTKEKRGDEKRLPLTYTCCDSNKKCVDTCQRFPLSRGWRWKLSIFFTRSANNQLRNYEFWILTNLLTNQKFSDEKR